MIQLIRILGINLARITVNDSMQKGIVKRQNLEDYRSREVTTIILWSVFRTDF